MRFLRCITSLAAWCCDIDGFPYRSIITPEDLAVDRNTIQPERICFGSANASGTTHEPADDLCSFTADTTDADRLQRSAVATFLAW